MNTDIQYYKEIPLRQIKRSDYHVMNARRFTLNGTNQNVWIPNRYLHEDGTLKANINIDFVFRGCRRKFQLAGIYHLYGSFKNPSYQKGASTAYGINKK